MRVLTTLGIGAALCLGGVRGRDAARCYMGVGAEDRRDGRPQRGAEHCVAGRLPQSQSPDGLSLYMASNRPRRKGRARYVGRYPGEHSSAWGAPRNVGEPVNSAADDFCPTPVGERGLFFVSREALPGACGQGDIYYTHRTAQGAWRGAGATRSAPPGPNSELDEQGPPGWGPSGKLRGPKMLYFSRSSVTPSVPGDIFMSARQDGARFGPARAVTELNVGAGNDIQPNVRADGLEVVFSSNGSGSLGTQDIRSATRGGR